MTRTSDTLLVELSDVGKKLDAIRARLVAGHYRDGCGCRTGEVCGWHAGISNQIAEARRLLQEVGRAVVKGA